MHLTYNITSTDSTPRGRWNRTRSLVYTYCFLSHSRCYDCAKQPRMAQRLSYFSLAHNQQMMVVARVGLLSAGNQLTIYVATPKMLQERGRWHRGDGCHGDVGGGSACTATNLPAVSLTNLASGLCSPSRVIPVLGNVCISNMGHMQHRYALYMHTSPRMVDYPVRGLVTRIFFPYITTATPKNIPGDQIVCKKWQRGGQTAT